MNQQKKPTNFESLKECTKSHLKIMFNENNNQS
jgi:hypothetical protein